VIVRDLFPQLWKYGHIADQASGHFGGAGFKLLGERIMARDFDRLDAGLPLQPLRRRASPHFQSVTGEWGWMQKDANRPSSQ